MSKNRTIDNRPTSGREKRINVKNKMIRIYRDTKKICRERGLNKNLGASYLFKTDIEINLDEYPLANDGQIEIDIRDMDTLDMCKEHVSEGLNPLVLNMASAWKPGGGVEKGCTAQEEVIFRRTNAIYTHLKKWYKLKENEVLYSSEVHCIKDFLYDLLDENEVFSFSMLAVAAPRKPDIKVVDDVNTYSNMDDYNELYDKIEAIFKIALLNGHDSLVLGAIGCGAYRNPKQIVADIFNEHIQTYGMYFKKISFAILVVSKYDQPNYDIFCDTLLE